MTDHPAPEDPELERLRSELRHLRARAQTHPLISQAQGILQERYSLPDGESAFALLQRASQQHNVRMRQLVEAVVRTPRPDHRSPLWFPQRTRLPAPPLTFPAARRSTSRDEPNQASVLRAVLSQTLAVLDTPMGNVQLPDRVRGGLRLEQHTGLTDDFVDFFAHVGEKGTSCSLAAQNVAQVTVHDVESDPVFDEASRHAILAAGSRAAHSVPFVTASGVCVGMVSAHLDHRLKGVSEAQSDALAALGAQAGQWLTWYNRTVLLDALEYLHALGTHHRGTAGRRR
ncbi:transcription antitermination regulator [Streptomyces spiroverticillatus]|uniref:Transcription antitermination regulator n=1 Tax=Streptomyces finlayi TaxID=67296 RepID=A0A919C835_9ACTN|nr:ANTAR domain-containing protein [Streptomyces finlayi]GGZ90256.1 transcription antitermination regulator [Streptomyces spiroverticillatus]GHC81102.1 transcription antitermination regulator [Streptomyces finlayi]